MMRNQKNNYSSNKGITSPHSPLFLDLLNSKLNSKINLNHKYIQGTMDLKEVDPKRKRNESETTDLSLEMMSPADTSMNNNSSTISSTNNRFNTIFTEEEAILITQQMHGHYNEHLNGQDFSYVFAGETLSAGNSKKNINQAKELEEFKFLKKRPVISCYQLQK